MFDYLNVYEIRIFAKGLKHMHKKAHVNEPFGVQRARKLRLEFRKSKKSSGVPLQGSEGLIIALMYFNFMSTLKGTSLSIG